MKKQTLRVLVLSDEHLREKVRTSGVTLEGDCKYAIEQIRDLCDMIRPDIVIHAGDIFNQRNISPEELNLFRELLEATGVEVSYHFTIQGNHDRGGETPIPQSLGCSKLSQKITELDTTTTVNEGVYLSLWGRDYDQEITKDKVTGDHKACINVLHFPCKPFNNRVEYALSVEDMYPRSLTIIGDTHISKLVEGKDERLVLSPGTLFPQNKTELCSETSTGVWLITVNGPHITKKDIIQLPFLSRRGLDLSDIDDMSEIEERVKEFLRKVQEEPKKLGLSIKPLTPVIYVKDNVSSVNVEGDFILVRITEGSELTPLSEGLEDVSTSISVIPELVKRLMQDEDRAVEVSELIMSMWSTNDPVSVLNDWLKKKEVPLNEAGSK